MFTLAVFWVQVPKTIGCESPTQMQVVEPWPVYTHSCEEPPPGPLVVVCMARMLLGNGIDMVCLELFQILPSDRDLFYFIFNFCACVCPYTCLQVPSEIRRGCWILWSWNYRHCEPPDWRTGSQIFVLLKRDKLQAITLAPKVRASQHMEVCDRCSLHFLCWIWVSLRST